VTAQHLWEQIYLRSGEISNIKADSPTSIEELSEHLTALDELIPSNIDPAEDFQIFVVSRLNRAANEVLLATLAQLRKQSGGN
jgi:hypothetical protein